MEVKPPQESRDEVQSGKMLQDDSGSNTVESSEDLHHEENNVPRDVENKVEGILENNPQPKNESKFKEVLQKEESVTADQVDTKKKTVPGEKGSPKKESNIIEPKYGENEHSDADVVVSNTEKDSKIPSVSKDGDGVASKSTSLNPSPGHIHIPKKVTGCLRNTYFQ